MGNRHGAPSEARLHHIYALLVRQKNAHRPSVSLERTDGRCINHAYIFDEASNPNHLTASSLTVPSAIASLMAFVNMSAKS